MSDAGLWMDFLGRASATAFVVVFIAWAAVRLGPAMGGILVGLPIVLAPGFYFLLRDYEPSFVAETAAGALFSLAATQVFLATYVTLSRRGALPAIGCSVLAWAAAALLLKELPHPPLLGGLLFVLVSLGLYRLTRRSVPPAGPGLRGMNWKLLIARGVSAGLLVALVTLLAATLGSTFAGLLIAFPIGFSVVALSLHLDYGAAAAAQALHAGIGGVTSLAAFTLSLALALRVMPPEAAFLLALLLSLLTTAFSSFVVVRRRRRPVPTELAADG